MTNIHASLEKLPKSHRLHPDKVMGWIKINTDMLVSIRKDVRRNIKGAVARQADIEGVLKLWPPFINSVLKLFVSTDAIVIIFYLLVTVTVNQF